MDNLIWTAAIADRPATSREALKLIVNGWGSIFVIILLMIVLVLILNRMTRK